jgi:hypothetical protein
MKNRTKLPNHVRRGLLRLYIALTPWVIWFGYQLLDALSRYNQHQATRAFWSLLIVPIGGPIIFLVARWVIAGFRKVQPTSAGTQLRRNADQNGKASNDFEAGRFLVILLMDLDDCWQDVCKVGKYDVSNSIARSEMAFARAAIIRNAVSTHQPTSIAVEMLKGVDKAIREAFAMKNNPNTLAHYANKKFSDVAPQAIRHYEQNLTPLSKLSKEFASRIKIENVHLSEIEALFQKVAEEANRLMQLSISVQKYSDISKRPFFSAKE